jgi:dienelactone hydrolase
MTVIRGVEDGNDVSWVKEWQALAERIEGIAQDTNDHGHYVSARDAYLRAASYYGAAMVAIDGLDEPQETLAHLFTAHRRCFDAHVNLLPVPAERLAIAYEDTTLPAYLFRPSDDGQPRPTLIVNNGSDAPLTVLHPSMVQPGLDRGYNVLLFDGPGQQSMLFQHQVPFRHDWEHVITPIVDHLLERADVDPDRLAIYGISQGGYWVPRAVAFEHRMAAAVVDPGVDDVTTSWRPNMPPGGLALFEAGDEDGFNAAMDALIDKLGPKFRQTVNWRCKPYGQANVYQTYKAVEQITTPMLVTDPEGEQFWPGQAQRLCDQLPGLHTHMPFTAAEGASMHIEPMARSLVAQRMFDWLDDTLGLKV